MVGFGIIIFTFSVVLLIIAVSLFLDAKKEYDTHIEKSNRNFGFPRKIDIDKKEDKK